MHWEEFGKSHLPQGPVCIQMAPPWLDMCWCEYKGILLLTERGGRMKGRDFLRHFLSVCL